MKYKAIKTVVLSALVAGAFWVSPQAFAADMSYEGTMPNSSVEMTAGKMTQVSPGKMEANLSVKHTKKLTKEVYL